MNSDQHGTERDERDWNRAWLDMFAPGGPLNTTESAVRSYHFFESLGLAVLLNPDRAEALIDEALVLGAELKNVVILVEAGATGAGAAALFPDSNVRVVQGDRYEDLVDVLLDVMPEHLAAFLNRPGGLRDKLKSLPKG